MTQADLFATPSRAPLGQGTIPTTAPGVTVFRQDAFTLRNIAGMIGEHLARPGLVMDGGRAFTLAGLLDQASAWTGERYAEADAPRALAAMAALTAYAEGIAPSMTSADLMSRRRGPRSRR